MNWKELDDDEQHQLKDTMMLLRDIPPADKSELTGELKDLKDLIDLHIGKFRLLIDKTIASNRNLNSILTSSDDILQLISKLRDSVGYEKMLEGVEEYTNSFNVEELTEEYRENTQKVNEYREVFKSLKELEKFVCAVCLEAPCDTFLDPCGHTVCSACATRVDKKCPYCRGTIFKARKMIFS